MTKPPLLGMVCRLTWLTFSISSWKANSCWQVYQSSKFLQWIEGRNQWQYYLTCDQCKFWVFIYMQYTWICKISSNYCYFEIRNTLSVYCNNIEILKSIKGIALTKSFIYFKCYISKTYLRLNYHLVYAKSFHSPLRLSQYCFHYSSLLKGILV